MSRFLETADVQKLTGYEKPSFQLRYCRKNGIQAWLNGRGEVVIPVCAIEGKAQNDADWKPDFSALGKRA